MGAPDPRVHAYGPGPDRFLELTLPDAGSGPVPAAGFAAVAVEDRRVGAGGGWPATLQDVAVLLSPVSPAGPHRVLDLRHAAAQELGNGAVTEFPGVARTSTPSATPSPTRCGCCRQGCRCSASTAPPMSSSPATT